MRGNTAPSKIYQFFWNFILPTLVSPIKSLNKSGKMGWAEHSVGNRHDDPNFNAPLMLLGRSGVSRGRVATPILSSAEGICNRVWFFWNPLCTFCHWAGTQIWRKVVTPSPENSKPPLGGEEAWFHLLVWSSTTKLPLQRKHKLQATRKLRK